MAKSGKAKKKGVVKAVKAAAKPAKKTAPKRPAELAKPARTGVRAISKPAARPASRPAAEARKSPKVAPVKRAASQPAPARPHVNAPEAKSGKRVSSDDRRRFREMLVKARERLTRQVDALKVESLQRTEEIITSEDGTDAFDRQFALSVASSEQDAVYEIDDAIRRLDTGTYGVCEECNCSIEKLRLKALPFVRMCVKCQSAREKNRPHFRVWTPEG